MILFSPWMHRARTTFDLYIEAAGNNRWGAGKWGKSRFQLKTAAVARFNKPAWDFHYDLSALCILAKELPVDSARRMQLLFALNAAVNCYRRGGTEAIAEARAILAIEYAKPAAASATNVIACGHSHIDLAWLWPIRETIRKCSRTFSTVLKYMETYPDYHYTQSQPQLYAYVKKHYPELYARIKQQVAEGRWEPQGAMWVEADCNITSGESLIRQILCGTTFFREEFGVENNILWLPDVFGYSAAMPQILKGCGIPYFMTTKISWNQYNKFPFNTFWWEGIDGTRVFSHFPPAASYGGPVTPSEVLQGEKDYKDKDRGSSWLLCYGHGDGGGGVTKEMLEMLQRMKNTEGLSRVTQGRADQLFPQLAAEAHDLRTWVGELYLELHRGTYTTQAKNKWENRHCELLLRDAECLSALHPNGLTDYPATQLDEAWKLVLLNQFHDIIPGSSIPWVYEDSARDYARVHEIAEPIVNAGLGAFTERIDTANLTTPVLVWNTLSFTRSGQVSLPWDGADAVVAVNPRGQVSRTQIIGTGDERQLLIEVVDVPSVGYATYDLLGSAMPEEVTPIITDVARAGERTLENDYVRVEFDACGGVISYFDKKMEREIIPDGAVGNLFQKFDDNPNAWDAWDIDAFTEETREDLTVPAEITVIEQGPLRAALRVERQLTPKARLVQEICLEANTRRVDFVTTIDWQEEHTLLKVAFPVDIYNSRATYEIQFGHVERPTHSNTSWDAARFEMCAHKWIDLSEGDYGVALLNNGKYGHDVHGNVLRLTLLRSPKWPDPNADMGRHSFTYSLLPHRGEVENSGVPLAGYDLNVPMLVQRMPVQDGVLAQSHSYFRLDKPNLIIEAIKRAEDGDGIIVRLYEALRRRGEARLLTNGLCTHATRTDLLERHQEELEVQGGSVLISFRPFEIITLRLR